MARHIHDMSVHMSKVDDDSLNTFCLKYAIAPEHKPTAPLPHHRITDCPEGYIALYTNHFVFSNLRIPFSNFFLDFLKQYRLHICQLSPPGAIRVTHFEIVCRALGGEPSLPLFRQFFLLAKSGDWYTVMNRREPALSCVTRVSRTLYPWKEHFFWVCADVIPFKMHWRQPDEALNVIDPHGEEFDMTLCRKLAKHPAPLQQFPEHVLMLTGLSRNWRHLKDMGLMKYIKMKGLGEVNLGLDDNNLDQGQGDRDEGGPSGELSECQDDGNAGGGGGGGVEVPDETFYEGGTRQETDVLASSSKRRKFVELMVDIVNISSSSDKSASERPGQRLGKKIVFSESEDDAATSDQVVGKGRKAKKEGGVSDDISWYRKKMCDQHAKNTKLKKKVKKLYKKMKRSTLDKGREAKEMVVGHAKVVAALQKELEDARAEGEEKLKVERERVEKLNGELEVKNGKCVSLEKSLERVSCERRWLIKEGFEYVINRLHRSEEYFKPLGEMQSKLWSFGAHEGVVEGYKRCKGGVPLEKVAWYNPKAEAECTKAADELSHVRYPYLVALSQCTEGTLDDLKELKPIGWEE